MKIITGWNVDGSRYSLYTTDPRDKAKNAHCPLCMAIDSDLHWICDCPCPALLKPRETLLQHTIPQLIRDILATVGTRRHTSYRKHKNYAEQSSMAYSTTPNANNYGKEPGPPILSHL